MKLEEATIMALQGKLLENKLDEVYTKTEITTFSELYDSSWGQAKEVLKEIADADKEEELMSYLEEFGTEDNPIGRTELNDILAYDWKSVYDAIGLDEDGEVKEDLDEARNPANDEINTKIRKTLNGSTKYMNDLKDAGLEVDTDDSGKATMVRNPNKVGAGYKGIRKADLKNSNPDTDYYNYMTKQKETPVVADTGAISPTNAFRDSTNFEKTYGAHDTTYRREDRNGVSKAIPKRYKTGNKNYDIDMDKFPQKSYDGVASYEPIENKELNDFKANKSQVADGGYLKRNLDKAQAEYNMAKQDYDKINNQVNDVRARIAKSKAKSDKKIEARSHKEDNERVAPRNEHPVVKTYNKEKQQAIGTKWRKSLGMSDEDIRRDLQDTDKQFIKRDKVNKDTYKKYGSAYKGGYDSATQKYNTILQDVDKETPHVQQIRKNMAHQVKVDRQNEINNKATENKKVTEATKLEETDITPDFLIALKDLFNKYLRMTPITDIALEEREGLSLITITFEDENKVTVNVTGDSNLATIKDILNNIG